MDLPGGKLERLEALRANLRDGWVITALGRESVEPVLGAIYALIVEAGSEFYRVEKPAKESWGAADGGNEYECVVVHSHDPENESGFQERLRQGLLKIAEGCSVDLVLQRESERAQERRLFCFDMDSTLIQGEVIDELAKLAGVADQVVAITASAMRGEIEFQESFRRRVRLLAGLPAARVDELLERIPLMEGAERLFRALRERGAKTAILSGGFTFFGAYLKERLGVDYVYSNDLDVGADGYVTGEVRGRIVDGARKAELLVEIAGREGIPLEQVVAVGDGANDLPMLGLAGMGVAFHAKPIVRAKAAYAMTHVGLDGLLYLISRREV